MIDEFGGVEVAYLLLCTMAWVWALSQVREAVYEGVFLWPPAWRNTTALWMVAKAAYFTFVGSVWWFDWFDPTAHASAIYALTFFHALAFVHWLKLPRSPRKPASPPAPEKDGLP